MWVEDVGVLPDRVVDLSWRHTPGPRPTPPEYGAAIYALDGAVQAALGADWTPDEIVDEVRTLCAAMSRGQQP